MPLRTVSLSMPNNEALQLVGAGGTFYEGTQYSVKEAVIRPGGDAQVTLQRIERLAAQPVQLQLPVFYGTAGSQI
jgi:hypothetical protein